MKILAVVALAAAFLVPAAQAKEVEVLKGTVGPGFTISLTYDGKKVTKLKPGAYEVKVSDKASIHNFHLSGPGVNKKTSVGGTGNTSWHVTLKKGKYTFVCDPHKTVMKGSFSVG